MKGGRPLTSVAPAAKGISEACAGHCCFFVLKVWVIGLEMLGFSQASESIERASRIFRIRLEDWILCCLFFGGVRSRVLFVEVASQWSFSPLRLRV